MINVIKTNSRAPSPVRRACSGWENHDTANIGPFTVGDTIVIQKDYDFFLTEGSEWFIWALNRFSMEIELIQKITLTYETIRNSGRIHRTIDVFELASLLGIEIE